MISHHDEGARKLRLALDLFEAGEELKRRSLKRAQPEATEDEIEAMIVEWLRDRPGARYGDSSGRRLTLEELASR